MIPILTKTTKIKIKEKWKVGKPFNPNFDGNLLAWYDGDTLATDPANTWSDRSANGFDLTLFNAPTIQAGAINGHDALRFDGINQAANNNNVAFLRTQPHCFYIVFRNVTYTPTDFVTDGGVVDDTAVVWQMPGDPDMQLYAGALLTTNPDFVAGNYNILTCVLNGANSEIRTNNNAAVVGNAGGANAIGLSIGSKANVAINNSNIEVSYCIIRNGADSTATQNLFINYLKNRFAL